jgi:hypothetical protein
LDIFLDLNVLILYVVVILQSIPEECSEEILSEQDANDPSNGVNEIKIFPVSDDEDEEEFDDDPFHGERGEGEGQEEKESCEDEENDEDTDTLGKKKKEDPEAIALKKRTCVGIAVKLA